MTVLGSGGHTTEALHLLSSLDLSKFTYRTYIVSSGDAFSAQKAADFERARGSLESSFTIKEIPRARRVGQSWVSTPASCLQCLMGCFVALAGRGGSHNWGMADVVVCNGPGSAVMVVLACLYYKVSFLAYFPSSSFPFSVVEWMCIENTCAHVRKILTIKDTAGTIS